MKKKWIWLLALMALLVVGCEQIADPNSSLNLAVDAVGKVIPIVGAGATATGTAWGTIAGVIATIIASALGIYNNFRKKVVINEKDADIINIELATRAIIDMVEALPDAIKEKAKATVKLNLQEHDFYRIGRAIIAGLKR